MSAAHHKMLARILEPVWFGFKWAMFCVGTAHTIAAVWGAVL